MAVVTHGVDIPPEVAPTGDDLIEPRLARTAAAASRPDIAAIGTPGPGCTLPPDRKSPGIGLMAPGREKMLIHPCVACP